MRTRGDLKPDRSEPCADRYESHQTPCGLFTTRVGSYTARVRIVRERTRVVHEDRKIAQGLCANPIVSCAGRVRSV